MNVTNTLLWMMVWMGSCHDGCLGCYDGKLELSFTNIARIGYGFWLFGFCEIPNCLSLIYGRHDALHFGGTWKEEECKIGGSEGIGRRRKGPPARTHTGCVFKHCCKYKLVLGTCV